MSRVIAPTSIDTELEQLLRKWDNISAFTYTRIHGDIHMSKVIAPTSIDAELEQLLREWDNISTFTHGGND